MIDSGKFNVTIVTRQSSSSTFPDFLNVIKADYSSVDDLTSVLKGQDAVVSTVGQAGLEGQSMFIKAAVAAGVKSFIPSDFGCDLSNAKSAGLPVFLSKVPIHKQLQEAAAANANFTYTSVVNNAFLDWGVEKGFLLNWKESTPKLYDNGDNLFSATTLATVGKAVVGVLSHPEETKNRTVRVKDVDITQKQLLDIVKKVQPSRQYTAAININTADLEKSSNESAAKGVFGEEVIYGWLFRSVFGPPEYGAHFKVVDNKLFGIEEKTEAELEEVVKAGIAAASV